MILPFMGFLMGLAYNLATGLIVLLFVPGVRLTPGCLMGYTCGAFAGAMGFGWVYTLVMNHLFGSHWPGAWAPLVIPGMGLSAVVIGYLVARAIAALTPAPEPSPRSTDLEGPVKDDADWS